VRVFLDANILFSSASPDSATRAMIDRISITAELVTNQHAWEEARRNIELKRPHLLQELAALKSRMEITERFKHVDDTGLPDKDLPVLGSAIASVCTHLWTGDKHHFGPLYGNVIQGTRVVSGVMLAKELDDLSAS
jgi:hypothetical protein